MKSVQIGVFSGPNSGKYGPEKTPYLDTSRNVNFKVFKKKRIIKVPRIIECTTCLESGLLF